jgi:hypothetical protein
MVLSEYISDLWAALTYYQSHPNRYMDLHAFVVYRSYRKLFKRIKQDTKTWNVHVAEKILAWKPGLNELRRDPQWFRVPNWWDSVVIPREQFQMMKTRNRGTPGKEFIEVEFSSATLSFWAWLLGSSLLHLENMTETANKKRKNGGKGFKEDLVLIAEWCITLHGYVNWSARIVETLLKGTSLANAFGLPWASVQRIFSSLSRSSFLIFFLCSPQVMATTGTLMTMATTAMMMTMTTPTTVCFFTEIRRH